MPQAEARIAILQVFGRGGTRAAKRSIAWPAWVQSAHAGAARGKQAPGALWPRYHAETARAGQRLFTLPIVMHQLSTSALPPIQACIVDLDGTLVNTLGDFEAALNDMLLQMGRAPVTRAQIARLVGKGSEHLVQSVLALEGGPHAPRAEVFDQAYRLYQQAYQRINGLHSQVYPGALEGLQALRALGLPLACLTNKPLAFAQALLQAKGLATCFTHVFGGDSFARKKPDPLPLLETCRALGTLPAHTLMVGDSSNDAAAARAAGCPVVLMTYGYNHGEPVSQVDADGLADAITELPARLQGGRAFASGHASEESLT